MIPAPRAISYQPSGISKNKKLTAESVDSEVVTDMLDPLFVRCGARILASSTHDSRLANRR